jgi:NAD(P)-dependent dehydrogenase (short-subunit alcohol dehydrogenase family)
MSDEVAIVTGAARGIGFAIARALASRGTKVCLLDLSGDALGAAAKTLSEAVPGAQFMVHPTDVADEKSAADAVATVAQRWGRVDVLVQAAGITGTTNITTEKVDPLDFSRVLRVNLLGIFLMCRAVLPIMRRQGYGRILNIASIAGKDGNAGMLAYSASKAAVIGLTKVVGKEYAESGITCNALAPAVVRTEMVAAMPDAQVRYMTDKIPMKRTGELSEIADLVCFVTSRACSFTTGFCFDATGGRATY